MAAADLACSNTPDELLRDLAWQSDAVGREAELAQRWRVAMAEADRLACDTYVLDRLEETGADFPTLVADCYAHYGMSPQELIVSLNRLLTRHAIDVHADCYYTRTDRPSD